MRYSELFEKRRGGDRNPRQTEGDIIKILNDYSRRNEYYFISYTTVDKLGINTQTVYNTPIGIYCYPLTKGIIDIISGGLSSVPFMGKANYIWLFRSRDMESGLDLNNYDRDRFMDDLEKLFIYINSKDSSITRDIFNRILSFSRDRAIVKTYGGIMWFFTRNLGMILAGMNRKFFTRELFNIGDRVFYHSFRNDDLYVSDDDGNVVGRIVGIDKSSKKYRVEFHVLDTEDYSFRVLDSDEDDEFEDDIPVDEYAIEEISFNDPYLLPYSSDFSLGIFWDNNDLSFEGNNNSAITKWTVLLYRVLGYQWVIDNGDGIIHGNEPIQAIFFNKSYIDVIERFTNPVRKR